MHVTTTNKLNLPIAIAALAIALLACMLIAPAAAHAASPTIITPTKAQDIAYNRCVRAAMNYATKPETITVNIKDLNLRQSQLEDIETRIHSNGELWWINTFALGLSTDEITMPCRYDDATITKMRKRFDAACDKALKRIGPGMAGQAKVHMLHDYLVRQVKYADQAKNAYEALVNKHADCFGYTLATDVLLRRAGFKTDVAFNNNPDVDHCWNLVRLGSTWYHVDTTWDRYFTYETYGGKTCHAYLLQSDKTFNGDDHKGWEAHHRCKSDKYFDASFGGEYFSKHCKDYKKIVRAFTKNGLRYTVTGVGKVSVSNVTKAKRTAKTLVVPTSVKYKNVTYAVTGLKTGAFKQASAKTLLVKSTKFSQARVKGSLTGSKVKTVKVPKAKLKAYKKYFAKSNSGKKVKVVGLTDAAMKKAVLKAQVKTDLADSHMASEGQESALKAAAVA